MEPDAGHERLETPEALREVIVAQRRELDALKRETADVAVLIDALDALLRVGGDQDPFAGVFESLEPVFRFSDALVLAERGGPGTTLRCIVSTAPALVGADWSAGRFFDKVLGGRVTATLASNSLGDWPAAAADAGLSERQPALYLPIGVRDHRGLMMLLREEGDAGFDRRHIALARRFSLLASHAFAARTANRSENERRRLRQLTEELTAAKATLAHRANYDELTGLPNRAFFEERVTRALRRAGDRSALALAFIDLDGFKQVNDLHGHEVGDGLLRAVADRIRAAIRPRDVLARISGDEFVLLIDPLEDRAALESVVERILGRLREPFDVDRVRLLISASIGVAVHPDHGSDYVELRRNADIAMYSAKSATKGGAVYFEHALGRAAAERTELEQELRRSVGERRFRGVLQPKVDLREMRVSGFEVLARRVAGDGGLRAPAEWLELATQLGLLDDVTDMLLDEVVEVLPALDAAFGPDTTISLNVSAAQATDPESMRALLFRLAETGCPHRFMLELTEDTFLQAETFQRQVLPLFREFGVRASLDDFGTGYTSLSTLLDITAHELKIDRSFITDVAERPRSQVVLQAIAAAGRALGLSVVAEGVETDAELRYLLAETPIATAQGYLFARPVPPAELIASAAEIERRLAQLRSRSRRSSGRRSASEWTSSSARS